MWKTSSAAPPKASMSTSRRRKADTKHSPTSLRLSVNPLLRQTILQALRFDPDPASREGVAELLLAEALQANRDGIVLFSSTSPARIAAAARVARDRPFTQDQIAGLRKLAAGFNNRVPQEA